MFAGALSIGGYGSSVDHEGADVGSGACEDNHIRLDLVEVTPDRRSFNVTIINKGTVAVEIGDTASVMQREDADRYDSGGDVELAPGTTVNMAFAFSIYNGQLIEGTWDSLRLTYDLPGSGPYVRFSCSLAGDNAPQAFLAG